MKLNNGFIPAVDIISHGLPLKNKSNSTEVVIKRNKKFAEFVEKRKIEEYTEKEQELQKMKEELDKLKVTKRDISDFKKDKKKDKKKKSSNDSFIQSLSKSVPDDISEFMNKGKKKYKKDKKKKKKYEKMVKKKKLNKPSKTTPTKTLKKDVFKSEVSEKFKEVEVITRENISKIDETILILDKKINELTSSSERVRGRDKALADYISAKTSLLSSRQKAATDILSNRAKIYDIQMRKERDTNNASGKDSDIIAKLFPGIALNSTLGSNVTNHLLDSGKNKDSKKKKKGKKDKQFYSENEDSFMRRERELIESGDIEYSKYDANIEYEGKFDVAIKKSYKDGEWKFVAIDGDGQFIDVPKSMLPSKKVTKMKFDDEKDVALDVNSNRMYTVYSVPYI